MGHDGAVVNLDGTDADASHRNVPHDPHGFSYGDDLFTVTNVPTPEEQRDQQQRVSPDRDQIVAFLKAVYPQYPTGVTGITAFTPTGRSVNLAHRLGTWSQDDNGGPYDHDHEWLADKIVRLSDGLAPTGEESAEYWPYIPVTGIFLRVPTTMADWPTGNQRGGQSNVCELIGFVLDGDYETPGHHERGKNGLPLPKDADEVLEIWAEAIGGQPTMIWNSGGGINGAWLLDSPVRITDDEAGATLVKEWRAASGRFHDRVVRAANARGRHHDSLPNNDRLMRIAGTVNSKQGTTPKVARIVRTDGPRYTLADLLALAPAPVQTDDGSLVDPLTGEVLRGPRPALQGTGAGTAHSWSDDGETPWDHYDREVWESGRFPDILRADGWTEEGYHNGILHFWRPGKGPGQQISATLGANESVGALSHGAKFFVFSDSAPGLLGTTYKGKFLSPSLYNAVTQHNADMKANAAALRRQGYGTQTPVAPGVAPDDQVDMWAGQLDSEGHAVKDPDKAATGQAEPVTAAAVQTEEAEQWAEPIPLEEEQPPPYDLTKLGELGTYARYTAEAISVPHGMSLMTHLGAVSAAVGGRRRVVVRPEWSEAVVLHTLALAPPGSKKSAAQTKASSPLRSLEEERQEADRSGVAVDEMKRQLLEERIKEARKRAVMGKTKADRDSAEADVMDLVEQQVAMGPPKQATRLMASDITPEELAYLMDRQGERMAIIESEASFLSIISGRYSQGGKPKLELTLSAYDHQSVTVDRVSKDEPVMLRNPNLTISLAVQGDAITGLGKSCAEMDKKGAWGRFLYDVSSGHSLRTRHTPEIPVDVELTHRQRIRALMKACYDDTEVRDITLSKEAADVFFEYYIASDPAVCGDHYRVRIKGWDEKQPGRIIRIAALRTLYEDPHALEIPAHIMRDIIELDATMTAHAHKASGFMQLSDRDPLEPARDVLDWLKGEMFTRPVKASEVQAAMRRKRRTWCNRLDDVLDALQALSEYHYLVFRVRPDGSRDTRLFKVHPLIAGEITEEEEAAVTAEETQAPQTAPPPTVEEKAEAESAEEMQMRTVALALNRFVLEFCETGTHSTHTVTTAEFFDAFASYSSDDGWLNNVRLGKIIKRICPDVERGKKRIDGKPTSVYKGIRIVPIT